MLERIDDLARLLAEDDKDRLEDFKVFWSDWFNHVIEGKKHTIIKEVNDEIVGVIRLWYTPHLDIGYLIEGLYVSVNHRKKGYASEMIKESIDYLVNIGESYIYSGCHEQNHASMRTHESMGFDLTEKNARNSYGNHIKGLNAYSKKIR